MTSDSVLSSISTSVKLSSSTLSFWTFSSTSVLNLFLVTSVKYVFKFYISRGLPNKCINRTIFQAVCLIFFTFYTWFLTSSVIFLNLFWSFIYFSTISHLICIFLSLIMSIVLCEMALYPYVELTLPSLNSSLVCCWKQKIRKYWKLAFSEGSESSKFELSGSIHCLWLK